MTAEDIICALEEVAGTRNRAIAQFDALAAKLDALLGPEQARPIVDRISDTWTCPGCDSPWPSAPRHRPWELCGACSVDR